MTAWTTPRNWTTPEVATESMLNTHVRDNTLHLRERLETPQFSSVTPVGNVGAGTDNLITSTIAAGTLGADAQILSFEGSGTFAANGNAKQLLLVFGSTSVTLMTASINGGHWQVDGKIRRVSATSQIITALVYRINGAAIAATEPNYSTATETLANALTLKFQAVGVADNDVVQTGMSWGLLGG